MTIVGAASPNEPGEPRRRPDLRAQTIFMPASDHKYSCGSTTKATAGVAWELPEDGGGNPLKCLRKGFLMNDETEVHALTD